MRLKKLNLICKIRLRQRQAGIALLISIFILMLISVVAIAMIVSSGTESALSGNYRASTGVYYAALAGLEEARGRLLGTDPNAFRSTAPNFLPAPGTTLGIGTVAYVLNPGPGEPRGALLTTYPDVEYDSEFGNGKLAAATVTTTPSMWNLAALNTLPVPGPLFKWVRINSVSEKSLNLNFDGNPGSTAPIYYNFNASPPSFTNSPSLGLQVIEITALAYLPNGSQKILQYLVVPSPGLNLSFPAALTIAGIFTNGVPSGVAFSPPNGSSGYSVKGIDQDSVGSCSPGPPVHSIGLFDDTDLSYVKDGGNGGNGIPEAMQASFTGSFSAPDVYNVVKSGQFPSNLQTPGQLDAMAQAITQNADAVITPTAASSPPYLGTATGSDLSSLGMSLSNPMTVVVNGNLDLNGWHNTGYGLLLVTGTLNYDPDASWYGMVMVIGQGTVIGSKSGSGEIDGGFLVARTRDPNSNALMPTLGKASVLFDDEMHGNGIRYSSCWIQKALSNQSKGARVLSFHEIAQQ